jgi:endonuclease/exonuclease/phosphatase family metal-dependent hydrolase
MPRVPAAGALELPTGFPAARPRLNVTTWNCARKKRELALPAAQKLGADFLVLQEIAQPAVATEQELWIGPNQHQGLSVISCDGTPIRRAAGYDEGQRHALPVEVGGAFPFQILAIWVAKEPVHYVPNLVAILDCYAEFISRTPTIVLGDFNANPRFDAAHPRYLFSDISAKFANLGQCSAYHAFSGKAFGEEIHPTHYHTYNQKKPFHIDYLFMPEAWRPALRSVSVGGFEDYQNLSDHRPLTVEWSTI